MLPVALLRGVCMLALGQWFIWDSVWVFTIQL
jgi:hypothetical protein